MKAPVAIVGIGCRFPGGVDDPRSFWSALREGRNAVSEVPRDRFDLERWYDARPATPGRVMTRFGGFLDHLDELDAAFFGISPREAERMDPQQRLLLETAWEALEDAGQDARRLEGSNTAVFVGQWLSDFEARLLAEPEELDFLVTTGSGRYATSGRLSYVLGLRGPSLTVDSACSSSLAAVHLAVRSLRSGECALALAGGVNVILQPYVTVAYSQSRMMAPDGRCKFGDASGDGYVRSEGAGVVVLKPLDAALADGDRVYAVIRGSAVNNDGRSSGSLGTPSRAGQEELLRSAYRDAGVAPGAVGYVEAHGTGTRTGDPVELGALAAVLSTDRQPSHRAYVGSLKTNFGHTEGAAGVAGLIKAALALHHGEVPPSLHFRVPHPGVPWSEVPFTIPTARAPWPDHTGRRVAGVSAFGIAGTNAHVVLEEAPRGAASASDSAGATAERPPALLPLSARSAAALRALAATYADRLSAADAPELRDACFTAATRRTHHEHRATFAAPDATAMAAALRRYAGGEPASSEGRASDGARAKIAFVVPGQGGQYDGMARELFAREPAFRSALARCDRAARGFLEASIVAQLHAAPGTPGYLLDRIDVLQPVSVALAIAYAALWRSFGVEPDAIVGHSMGEVGAAHLAGALELEQAMEVICRRSALMRRMSGRGAMALVELTLDEARARLAGREDRVSVAVSNSPRSTVISGDPASVKDVLAELERERIFCRLVKVDVASHSPQMAPLAAELASALAGLSPTDARVPLHSTVLGRRITGRELDARYWARNLREPVLFGAAVEALLADGVTVFVELGPHPVLLPSIQQTANSSGVPATILASGRREEPQQAAVLAAVGAAWAAGAAIDWKAVAPPGRIVDLPRYAWQRERHWVGAAEPRALGDGRTSAEIRPGAEELGWFHRLDWQPLEPPAPVSTPPWLVVSSDARAADGFAMALREAGAVADVAPLDGIAVALAGTQRGGRQPPERLVVVAPSGPDAPYLPVAMLQALLRSGTIARPRVWFVTRGAQSVSPSARQRIDVDQAALWGAARVVGEEHPELWGGLVDLDPAAPLAASAPALARHLLAGDGEEQVALRGGRFVLRALQGSPARGARFAWRADAAYLVTGGLGDLGLRVANAMIGAGARRIILVGRTPLPPRSEWARADAGSVAGQRIAAVRALERAGAAVHVAAVDIADESALRAFLDGYAAEGWPPIRGVVHAAAVLENTLAASMDRRAFDAVLRPKLVGARLLDRLLPDLDLFVVFSSVVTLLAQTGEVNYAAANAGLDALAHDRHARGLPALSIAWGVWTETGFAKGAAGERVAAELARQGVHGFSPERGAALFRWLCGCEPAYVAVLPIDWGAFHRARSGRGSPLYRHLVHHLAGRAEPASFQERLERMAPAERRRLVQPLVLECVSKVLKIAPARLDARTALGSLGLTSLLAMELRNGLEAALGRSLSATLAWNYPTIEALVEFLANGDGAARSGATRAAGPDDSSAHLSDHLRHVLELSDEEIARALRGGVGTA